jgi:hypothetical protein
MRQWLDHSPPDSVLRRAAIYLLVKLAHASELFPTSLFVDVLPESLPSSGGGSSFIFRGTWNGQLVVVKRPKILDDESKSVVSLVRLLTFFSTFQRVTSDR